ncbi:3-oxoacyl-[acyl-carrier-protein] synthase-3 [Chitinophaga jiangningensis]|uniref:3-oxoacyl-[acyl-carrier-protein] synthase-3 n=1 Tax=Chitinophaga jiangningensis TaxID=1419482 RepID=A0A1M6YL84_9BACT|nr:beta-ketoacyl-ACP synthase III [Chitinophaga jiangningensis]SHL19016.1 3-oxoacyl-[acyl-carrier-protein] synthase-3 [Chitinophaga jiangningensis]
MKKYSAVITAVGGYVPEHIIGNAEIEERLNIPENWIPKYLGVKERRLLKGEGVGTSVICVNTALEICNKRGISPEMLDAIVLATSTPDMIAPNTSSIVAKEIGASRAWGIDINGACSGFLSAMDIASRYVEQGIYQYVMVLGADKMSSLVDEEDRITASLFGDGGGGVLLEPGSLNAGIQDALLKTDGHGGQHLYIKAGGSAWPATNETVSNREHFMYMNGRAIFDYAVQRLTESIGEILQRNQLSVGDIDWLVPHQANKRIIERTAEVLNFPKEKIMFNVDRYGNTTAGTIPLCLWDYEPRLRKGDRLLFAAFGAGFTWGALYVVWDYDGDLSAIFSASVNDPNS